MTSELLYEYIDESSIYPDLICVICREPFQTPLCTPCDHTFCSVCIHQWLESEGDTCPNCRQPLFTFQLKTVNRILTNILNRIQVQCLSCGEKRLSRGLFDHHVQHDCPKIAVSCRAKDSHCPWTGERELLNEHLKTCHFYSFQPFVDKLGKESLQIHRDMDTLIDRNAQNTDSQKVQLNNIHGHCQWTIERFDDRLINNEERIETHELKLIEYPVKITECLNRLSQIESQNQSDQQLISRIHQQHIQLEQLTLEFNLFKNFLDDYENLQLENAINQRESCSWIDLSRRSLTDRDMRIVLQHAIINKQCQELDLRRNEIHSQGIEILTDDFDNIQTLKILYLSFNFLSDSGVEILAKSISFLTKLELDSNEITDRGAISLAEMLKSNTNLLWLSLEKNQITSKGLESIGNSLIHFNRTLEELYLSGNRLIDGRALQTCSALVRQNLVLKKVWMENCGWSQKGKGRLRQLAKARRDFSLLI